MSDVVAAVERLAAEAGPDDVLRGVVDELVASGSAAWAGISFVEEGALVLGPEAGTADSSARTSVPVAYGGTHVAELAADRCADPAVLERVAGLIGLQCLVGWDADDRPWDEE